MAEIKLKIASVVIGSGEGGGGGVAPYYADLPDKPSINGETLSGDMTSEDLGLASESQAVPSGGTTGQVLAKKSNADNDVQWVNQQSGGQGTTNYVDLENKPKINNVTLSGNKTAAQLGLQPELVSGTNIKTINSQSLLGSGNITIEGGGADDYADLSNKPQINSVSLSGNKSASDLGLATAAQGEKADNAIPMPIGTNGQILEKDSNETSGVKWVQKPQDGKSALQIYNETYGTNLNEAQFIDVLKQNYPMEYVAYNQTAAEQSIGTGFSAIGTLAADSTTAGKMYLMPNDVTTPTGTILFVTVQTGVSTYEWYKLGDLDVPSNVLTEDDTVNTLTSTSTTKPLSANQGKVLNDTLRLAQPTEQTINLKSDVVWLNGYYYIKANGNLAEYTGFYKTSDYINLPSNAKTINYEGGTSSSSIYKQVAVYNDSNECLGTFFQYPLGIGNRASFDISNLVGATKMRISEYDAYVNNNNWNLSIVVEVIHTNQEVFEDFTQSVDDRFEDLSQSVDDRFDEVDEHFENFDNNYYLSDPVDVETNLKDSVVWLEGYYYILSDGTLQSDTLSVGKVSEYINLLPNTKSIKYKCGVDTNTSHYHCAIYDAQENCLATFRDANVSASNAVVFDITEYPTATKMRIGEWISYINNNTWDISVIHSVRQTNKETYDELLDWIDSLNQWKGKKFIVFGASNTSGGFSDGTSWIQMAAERLKMQPPISGMVSRRVSLKYVDGALNLVGLAATVAECQSISASTTISYETQFAKDFDCVLFGGFAGESYDESQVVIDGTTYYGGEELIDLIKLPTTRYNNNPQFTYSNGDTLAQHRDSYIGAVIYVLNELWKIKPTCRVVFTRAYLNWRNYDSYSRNFNGVKKLCDKLHLPFIDLVEGVYFNGFTTGTGAEEDKTNPNIFLYDGEHASLAGRQRLGNIFTHRLLLIS